MKYILLLYAAALFNHPSIGWGDFKGCVPKNANESAQIVTNIELTTVDNDGTYTFSVSLEFDKEASWTATDDPKILRHETGHWDISWLARRRIEKALLPYQGTRHPKEAEKVYDKMIREWGLRERRYDLETNHSRDVSAQKRWEKIIERELATCGIF